MGMEIFLCQDFSDRAHNGYITKSTRSIKCYARNLDDQNLYNPVTLFLFFSKTFCFFQKKAQCYTVLFGSVLQCVLSVVVFCPKCSKTF